MEHSNPDIKVTVYNSRHEKVYPYAESSSENYYAEINRNKLSTNNGQFITTKDGNSVLFTYNTLDEYDWAVIVTRTQQSVYLPLLNYRTMVIIIGGFSIILTMIICFYISQKLTKPLEKLTRATGKITLIVFYPKKKVTDFCKQQYYRALHPM